jgi:hypothetical protein
MNSGPALPATKDLDRETTELHQELVIIGVNTELLQTWSRLKRFRSTINSTAEHKHQLPKKTLLSAVASSMHCLLHLTSFGPTSADEVVRLGLLGFSSYIVLEWQDLTLPHTYLSLRYRQCLLSLKVPGILPSPVLFWLQIFGAMAIFDRADDAWLLPWMRTNIDLCESHTCGELRRQLKSFP